MASVAFRFDGKNTAAQVRARRHAAKMVTAVTEETRAALAALVRRAIREQIPPYEAARTIRTMVGMNQRQAAAAMNYRAGLIDAGMPITTVDKKVERYVKQKVAERAVMIARTETMDALNGGLELSWKQAQFRGLLDPNAEKEWMVTPDDRLCPRCTEVDGARAPVGQAFEFGVHHPPLHPLCRCTVVIARGPKAARTPARPSDMPVGYKGGGPSKAELRKAARARKDAAYRRRGKKKLDIAHEQAKASPEWRAKKAMEAQPINSADAVKQTGGQGGSNPGGRFLMADGSEWYIKAAPSAEYAANEVLTAKLYEEAGIRVVHVRPGVFQGKPGVASRIVSDVQTKLSPGKIAQLAGAQEGFAVDAWLANWDVIGLEYDNIAMAGGKALRMDTGGGLLYRAMGAPKGNLFGKFVGEIDTLRKASMNKASSNVFKSMTKAQIRKSMEKVLAVSDDKIRALAQMYGPKGQEKKLADLLIERKRDIGNQYAKLKPPRTYRPAKPPLSGPLGKPHTYLSSEAEKQARKAQKLLAKGKQIQKATKAAEKAALAKERKLARAAKKKADKLLAKEQQTAQARAAATKAKAEAQMAALHDEALGTHLDIVHDEAAKAEKLRAKRAYAKAWRAKKKAEKLAKLEAEKLAKEVDVAHIEALAIQKEKEAAAKLAAEIEAAHAEAKVIEEAKRKAAAIEKAHVEALVVEAEKKAAAIEKAHIEAMAIEAEWAAIKEAAAKFQKVAAEKQAAEAALVSGDIPTLGPTSWKALDKQLMLGVKPASVPDWWTASERLAYRIKFESLVKSGGLKKVGSLVEVVNVPQGAPGTLWKVGGGAPKTTTPAIQAADEVLAKQTAQTKTLVEEMLAAEIEPSIVDNTGWSPELKAAYKVKFDAKQAAKLQPVPVTAVDPVPVTAVDDAIAIEEMAVTKYSDMTGQQWQIIDDYLKAGYNPDAIPSIWPQKAKDAFKAKYQVMKALHGVDDIGGIKGASGSTSVVPAGGPGSWVPPGAVAKTADPVLDVLAAQKTAKAEAFDPVDLLMGKKKPKKLPGGVLAEDLDPNAVAKEFDKLLAKGMDAGEAASKAEYNVARRAYAKAWRAKKKAGGLPATAQQHLPDDYDRSFSAVKRKWRESSPRSSWVKEHTRILRESEAHVRDGVNDYIHSWYRRINETLRNDPMLFDKLQGKPWSQLTTWQQRAVGVQKFTTENAPPKGISYWRGVKGDGYRDLQRQLKLRPDQHLSDAAIGSEIESHGFMSSSLSPDLADGWVRGYTDEVVMEIKASRGAWVSGLNEYEMLMPHGSKFRVDAIKRVPFNGRMRWIVQVTQIAP